MISMLLVACGTPVASPAATPSATLESTTASDSPSPASSPRASLIEPGQPFDREALLAAMRDSPRPEGVPEELQTDAIATALGDLIWTFDGEPWTAMAISGSCGAKQCTIEVAGTRPETGGDDVWVVEVTPANAAVEFVSANLHSLPADVVDALDEQAREATDLDGMLLASARWQPPPDDGDFVLSYRTGDEEGSCMRDLTLRSETGEIVGEETSGC